MRAVLIALAVMTSVAGGAIAAWQVRDGGTAAASAPSGSGVLRGIVVTDAAVSRPVRRAAVRIASARSIPRVLGTDDDGRFQFDRLPGDKYTVSASKPGFVQTFYGSTMPGIGPGVPVAVADDGAVEITLKLLPGGAIAGVITDARGIPAPGIAVAAVDTRSRDTVPRTVRSVSDDRGAYRIFGLAPGDYLVSALPQLTPASDGRGGPSRSRVTAVTESDVQWARRAVASATGGVGTTGETPPAIGAPVAYAPVFYPSTTDAAAAVIVRVGSGAERTGIDLSLQLVRLAGLSGSLADAEGAPVTSATVSLIPRRSDRPSSADALLLSGVLALPRAVVAASAFSFSGVAPGQYSLVARTGSGQRGVVPAEAGAPTLWSVTDVTIEGGDRREIALRLLPGLSVAGRYVFEPDGDVPDPAALNLSLLATHPLPGVSPTYRAGAQLGGTFRVPGLAPGTYLVRADVPASSKWLLKSAVVNGRDLADRPLVADADGSQLTGVVVTFTDRMGEISGRLLDAGGRPVSRYSMVVFTTDASMWLPNARRVRALRPATDGGFSARGLPAGEYAIAAAEAAEGADIYAPAFLTALLPSAIKVTVGEGESRRQDFRVAQ